MLRESLLILIFARVQRNCVFNEPVHGRRMLGALKISPMVVAADRSVREITDASSSTKVVPIALASDAGIRSGSLEDLPAGLAA